MSTSLAVRLVLWVWLAAAFYIGQAGLLRQLPPPAVFAVPLTLAALLLLLHRRVAAVTAWADALSLRALVLFHVTRFVGFYFLYLYREGVLPPNIAIPAGIGDIGVALFAAIIALLPMPEATRLRAISIWNVVGLVDILLVLSSGLRAGLSGSRDMIAFTYLPLSFLPTFLVPLILASHVLIFMRLARLRAGE